MRGSKEEVSMVRTRVTARRILVSLAALVLLTAACAPGEEPAQQEAGKSVKLGFLLALSGSGSAFADPVVEAVELAVAEVNEAGGVLGRQIELVTADDATDPRTAEREATRLIEDEGVAAVISLETSANREAIRPIADKAGVPVLYGSYYEGSSCGEMMFIPAAVPNQQVEPGLEYMANEFGSSKWFFMGSDYNWPRITNDIAKGIIADQGGEVVGEEYVPFGTTEYGGIVSKIDASGADTIFVTMSGGDSVSFMKQWLAAGGKDRQRMLSLSLEEATLEAIGPEAAGVIVSYDYFATLDTPENQAFIAALEEEFGGYATPTTLSVPNYDSVHLWARAVEEAGTFDGQDVADALTQVEFTGPRGPVKLNEDHHATLPIYLAEATEEASFNVIVEAGSIEASEQCPEF